MLTIRLSQHAATAAALAIFLTLVAAPAPAAEAAQWSAPEGLSEPGVNATEPRVAVDPGGDAIAVWDHWNGSGYTVQAATRSAATHTWSPPADLSAVGVLAGRPRVAVDSQGDAIVTWDATIGASRAVQAATHAAGSAGWTAPVTLSAALEEADAAEVAMDPQGQAIVAYVAPATDTVEVTRTQAFGGAWSTPIGISAAGHQVGEVTIAYGATGAAVVAWERFNGSIWVVQCAERSPSGAWTSPTSLAPSGQVAQAPRVAVDAGGDAAALWTGSVEGRRVIQVATRRAGDAWGGAKNLSSTDEDALDPAIGLDAAGDAVAVWEQVETGPRYVVRTSSEASGTGAWTFPVDLSGMSSALLGPALAVDPVGDAVVTWQMTEGAAVSVQATGRTGATGTWSSVAPLSTGNLSLAPRVAIDARGDAVATWLHGDGVSTVVQAAALDVSSAPIADEQGGAASASPGGGSPPPPPRSAKARCPKGKRLRKVRVRVHTKRHAGAKGKSAPKFKTELKCVAPAPRHGKKPSKHHRPEES